MHPREREASQRAAKNGTMEEDENTMTSGGGDIRKRFILVLVVALLLLRLGLVTAANESGRARGKWPLNHRSVATVSPASSALVSGPVSLLS